VDGDIGKIASMGFAAVRIYNSDCSQLTYVGDACKKYGLRLSVGLWITSPDEDAVQSQIQAITSYFQGDYGIVAHVVVGNEVLANTGYGVTASCLAGFINTVRAALRSAGYAGSVSTSEVPGPLFAAAGTLCPAIDDVLANVHPFFDPNTSAGQAGTYVAGILGRMEAMCGGSRRAWNMETGWPTAGQADGQAVPGFAEQQTAVLAIKAAAGDRSSFFSFEDDLWKGKGLFQVEQSWGLASLYDLL
jgi:exo-beta-1,3-glucanase (GH17 family)